MSEPGIALGIVFGIIALIILLVIMTVFIWTGALTAVENDEEKK